MVDAAAAKITKRVHREFRQNRLAHFDEMNRVGVKKHVAKLYKNTEKIIRNEFLAILNPLYKEIYDEALALGFDGKPEELDEGWIEEFFEEYNPVTKYVFKNELVRKEARLFENLIAVKGSLGTDKFTSYKTAENLLARQVKQYAIELEDSVTKAVYQDAGVKKVMWVAEDDHKTCAVCNELDGAVFDLEDAPPKQHYHCRCYLIPVKG